MERLSNIPRLSSKKIQSIWQLASNPRLFDIVSELLKEVVVTDFHPDKESVICIGDYTNIQEKYSTLESELSEILMGKVVVFTGVQTRNADSRRIIISRDNLTRAVQYLGVYLFFVILSLH